MTPSSLSQSVCNSGVPRTGRDLPAVARRIGVVRAHDALDVRKHALRLLGAGGDHAQRADALAVDRKRLGKRARQEYRRHATREQARRVRVFLDALSETLIREVEEGDETARAHDLEHRAPLVFLSRSTPVGLWQHAQHDDGTCGNALEAALHAGEIQLVRFGVVIGVRLDGESGCLEELAMVFSQLGSLIQTCAEGLTCLRKSAPIFKPPVPPSACTVTMFFS